MNPVAEYIKNIGRSVKYATVQHLSEKSPAAASFVESNQDLYKEVFHGIRDYKTTIQRAKNLVKNSPVYKAGDMAFDNALEDIKSGNLYNKGREDSSFGSFDDFDMESGIDDGFGGDSSGADSATDFTTGDQMVVKTVANSSKKNAYAVSNAVASSAEYIAGTSKAIANQQYIQATRTLNTLQTGFSSLSSGVDALHRFNTDVMSVHVENSKKFFETSTCLLQEQNAILKEMVTMQREKYKVALEEEKEKKANRIDDVFNANGIPDMKNYAKVIWGNTKNTLNEQSGGMMSMLSEENLKMLASNPLGFIPQFLISSMMGPKLNTALEKFDSTMAGMFTTFTAKMNKNANDENASPMEQFLGKIFGVKNNVKNTIDTSKFEKGAVPFNGITQKSIVEVIPGHLRRIEALLSGQNERFFDHNSGKWTDAKSIKTSFANIKKSNVQSSMSDVSDEMGKMMQSLVFKERRDKEAFLKDMQSMFTQIYDDGGFFDPNNKKSSAHTDYGVQSKANFKILQEMYKNLKRKTVMATPGNVMSQREMHNKNMENIEKEGYSLYGNLTNNYGMDSHIRQDSKTQEIKEKYGNLGDSSNLLKIQDPFKKNIFDYLRMIHQELFIVRKGGSIGGKSRGKKGKFAPDNNTIDFNQFTEKDWKNYYESQLGPKDKSNAKLREEQEANLNEQHRVKSQEDAKRAKANGKIVAEVDQYMDDTSAATGAIYTNAHNAKLAEDRRTHDANETWLNKMMADSAKKARKNISENPEMKDGATFLDQLLHAGSLGAKYDVIRNGIDKLTAKPSDLLTGMLTKADQNIYDFFYGKETGVTDEKGNKVKGFFNRMVFELKGTFGKVNDWIDNSLLKPFKDKFGGKSMWEAGKNALKKYTNIDVDEIFSKAKGFFVGDNGILQPTIDAVKDTFKQAYEEAKKDLQKSKKDANQFYHNQVLGEQTDEQKLTSAKKKAGVDHLDESRLFRTAMANSSKISGYKNLHAKLQSKEADLLNKLNSTTDPKERARIEKQLDIIYTNAEDKVSQKSKEYDETNSNITKVSSRINEYAETDEDKAISAKKAKHTKRLDELKNLLGVTDLSKVNLESDEYSHLNTDENKADLEEAKSLQKEISKLKTGMEKLTKEKAALEAKKKSLWDETGTSKDKASLDPKLLLEYAKENKNKSEFRGNRDFEDAINYMSSILNVASSRPEAKQAYKTVEALAKEYKNATTGMKGDPLKGIQVDINRANSQGDIQGASELTEKLNTIIASKGALVGRYTNIFSNALGKIGISEDRISGIVSELITTNSLESLGEINTNFDKFVSEVGKIDSSLTPLLQSYSSSGMIKRQLDGVKFGSKKQGKRAAKLVAGTTRLENFTEVGNKFVGKDDKPSARDEDYYKILGMDLQTDPNAYDNRTNKISHFATGARNITKSGLTIVSEGEAIIPSDVNPYNPNLKYADRAKDAENEKRIKQRIGKSFDVNDIAQNAEGSTAFGTKENTGFAKLTDDVKSGATSFFNTLFNTDDSSKILTKTNEEVRKHLPKGIAGGLLGGTVGLLTGIGGPLLGAVAGSAISVVSNSETLQKSLFGEKVYDAEGNETGKRAGGLFSSEFQDTMKKYLPDAKTYGITGTVLGMLTPLGPLGGLMMGSAISFAKNNETVKNSLFGKTGLINDDSKKIIQKVFPHVAAGAISTMFLGPFGLLGNAILGSGIGLATTTDEFKDMMLGKADAKGNRKGGLAGSLRSALIDPLASFGNTMQSTFVNFVKRDMLTPLKRSIAPLGKQISLAMKDTMKIIGKTITGIVKPVVSTALDAVLTPIKIIAKPLLAPFKKGMGKISGFLKNGLGKVVSSPFKALEAVADTARAHQISKSNADYMTASERLEFMASKGKDYKLKDYDTQLAGAKKGDLVKVSDLMGELKKGKKFVDSRHDEYSQDLKDTVYNKASSYKWDKATAYNIHKAAQEGDMQRVQDLIQQSNLSTAEKQKLSSELNEKADKYRESKYRKDNYTGNENDIYKTLQEKHGIKGINAKNIDKYRSVLETEIQSRHDKTPSGAEEEQMSSMNSALETNTDKLVDYLKPQLDTLTEIRDTLQGITPEQRRALVNDKEQGKRASEVYKNTNDDAADSRNKAIESLYGGDTKIDARHRYSMTDNKRRHKMIRKSAEAGHKLNDINTAMDYSDKQLNRFLTIQSTGYDIKDYDKIAKMSQSGFDNVVAITKSGMKITDMDAIIEADPEILKGMVELYKAGYTNESQKNLMEMAKSKSRYLSDKFKGKAMDAMNSSKNADSDKASHGIIKNENENNTHDYRSFGDKVKDTVDAAKEITAPLRSKYGAAIKGKIKSIGETLATKDKGFANMFAEGAASISKGGVAVVSKGERIEPAKQSFSEMVSAAKSGGPMHIGGFTDGFKAPLASAVAGASKLKDKFLGKQVPTDYGMATYTKATDGSMRMDNSKDNKAITDHIAERDNTQKGILENLKILAGTAKGKAGNAINKTVETAKGGLLGALSGLLGLFKMPLTLLKSMGSLLLAPLEMLGLGGLAKSALGWAGGKIKNAASWAGNKALDAGKTAFNWAGDKAGILGGKLKDKFMGTKFGQKVGKWNDKFTNSKVGKWATKGKNAISGLFGGGEQSSATEANAIGADGNPVDEPTDMIDAINVNRTSIVSYLQQILDAINNNGSGGAEDNDNPLSDLANGDDKKKRRRRGSRANNTAGNRSSKWAKAGKIGAAVAGVAALSYGAYKLSGGGDNQADYQGPDTPTQNDPTGDNKALGTIGGILGFTSVAAKAMNGLSPDMVEKAQVFLAKAKDGLSAMVTKLGKWIPNKGVYAGVQEFCAKLIEKISTPKCITKIVEKLGTKLAMGPAYAAGLAAGGVGAIVVGAAETVGWFLQGWSSANEMLHLQSGATTGMKFVVGLVNAAISMIPIIGIVIPTDTVLDLAIEYVGAPFGFGRSDIEKIAKANEDANKKTSAAINNASSESSQASNPTSDSTDNASEKSTFQTAVDTAKKMGSDAYEGAKSGVNYVIDKGADALKSIKEKGAAAVDWVNNNAQYVANKASDMWQNTKSTVSSWFNGGKGKYGYGKTGPKYGRGLAAGFNSQLDPANAMDFNAAGDTVHQSMKDSGCGPVSATNMASALGVSIDPKAAASYALNKGYKEKDGGTEPGYFGDLLGNYGIGTEKVNSSDSIKDNLSQGNPVLLMGKDGKGVNSKNPYGEYNHYVVGTGMDGKGNITVQDPESTTPDQVYKASDVLNKSSMAIAAGKGLGKFGLGNYLPGANKKKSGKGKYGMGYSHDIHIASKNDPVKTKSGKGKWGRGGDLNPEHMWALANWVSEKIGLKPEFVYGQWYHESGGFSSRLAKENYNFGGMTQSQPTGDPADKQPDGTCYYMHFGAPEEWAEYYAGYIKKCDGVIGTNSVPEFAQALKDNGYYGASVDEYINGVSAGIAQIPGKYDTSLVDSSKFGKRTSGTASSGSNKPKNTGLFGKLAELSSVMSGALDLSGGKGKWGRGPDGLTSSAPADTTTPPATTPTPAAATPATTPAAATTASSGSFLDGAIAQAKQLAGSVQGAFKPLAGNIMSSASKMFGDSTIKTIFGDDNPFSSIFGSKKKTDGSKNNSSSSNGSFTSSSTNEGIKKASDWANQLVSSDQPQGYGPNGCTAFAKDYLQHAGNPFADQMDLYCPTLKDQAKSSGLWKEASQGGAEGDIALVDTNNNMTEADGPDHAVIADGQGGFFGNSSSTLKVKHGPMADTWGADKIWGYVSTGAGNANVVSGAKTNGIDVAAEAGPGSQTGAGKYGLGKFGIGNYLPGANKKAKNAKGKYGRSKKYGKGAFAYSAEEVASYMNREYDNTSKAGEMADALAQLATEDPDQYQAIIEKSRAITDSNYSTDDTADYNAIQPGDSNDVIAAKNAKNAELAKSVPVSDKPTDNSVTNPNKDKLSIVNNLLNDKNSLVNNNKKDTPKPNSIVNKVEKNVIDINKPTQSTQAVTQAAQSLVQTQQQLAKVATSAASIGGADYGAKFDTMIALLTSIATALGAQTKPATANSTTQQNATNPAASIMSKLSTAGNGSTNGTGDLMAGKDTQSIINSMQAIIAR